MAPCVAGLGPDPAQGPVVTAPVERGAIGPSLAHALGAGVAVAARVGAGVAAARARSIRAGARVGARALVRKRAGRAGEYVGLQHCCWLGVV